MTAVANATGAESFAEAAADEQRIAGAAKTRLRRRRWAVRVTQLLILVVGLGFWQIGAIVGFIDPFFFGSPIGIVQRLADWFVNGNGSSGRDANSGIVISTKSAAYIKIVNALPRIVRGSIFVIWLWLGLPSKVLLAAVLVFFVVFFNAFQGVRSVDRNLVANAKILGASRLQIVQHVVVPSAMTWIIASLHVALGFSIIGAIVGEFLGAQGGLGLVIATAQNAFDSNGVFGAMLVIGLVALSAEGLMSLLENRLLAWRPTASGDTNVAGL